MKKYEMNLSFTNHAEEDIIVTTGECGDIMIQHTDLNDPALSHERFYLNAEEVDRFIEMLTYLKEHIK